MDWEHVPLHDLPVAFVIVFALDSSVKVQDRNQLQMDSDAFVEALDGQFTGLRMVAIAGLLLFACTSTCVDESWAQLKRSALTRRGVEFPEKSIEAKEKASMYEFFCEAIPH